MLSVEMLNLNKLVDQLNLHWLRPAKPWRSGEPIMDRYPAVGTDVRNTLKDYYLLTFFAQPSAICRAASKPSLKDFSMLTAFSGFCFTICGLFTIPLVVFH